MFYGLVQYPSSWHVKPSAPGWKLRSNACHWEKTTSLDSRHPWQHHDPNKITTSRKVTRDPQWLAKKKNQQNTSGTVPGHVQLDAKRLLLHKAGTSGYKNRPKLEGNFVQKNFCNEDACRQTTGGSAPAAWRCLASLFNRLYYLNETRASSWAEGCIYKTGWC